MTEKLTDTLLLIGSADSDRALLRAVFENSYNLLEAENAVQGQVLLRQNGDCIAAVLLDLPFTQEEEILAIAALCRENPDHELPLLILVSHAGSAQEEETAFRLGATDVITKPYTVASIRQRIRIITEFFLHRWNLEQMVNEQSETIRNANQVMVDALSAIIEHRSTESGNHVLRIRRFTKILLEDVRTSCPEYGLTDTSIDIIASASSLHDIGKIAIPDDILNKPGALTREEFEIMKTHTSVGSNLVQTLGGIGDTEYLRYAYNIALYHHERWDGSGYPVGLAGDEIPICAQAVGIADCFDALTTKRVYKDALPYDQAINMIINGECGIFSPRLLECFKHVRSIFVELASRYADGYSPKSDVISVPLPGPVWQAPRLNTLQLSQTKYQTLMHHINDTVMELDFDHGVYHVVYSPDPAFDHLSGEDSMESTIEALVSHGIHPDDAQALQNLREFISVEYSRQQQRRMRFDFRVFDPLQSVWRPYEVTILRLDAGNETQHLALAVWHRADSSDFEPHRQISDEERLLKSAPYLQGLVNSILCCRADPSLTVAYGLNSLYTLTGYTKEELETQFESSFAALIHPEDAPEFRKTILSIAARGGVGTCEFRIRTKSGGLLWVLDRCRFHTDSDGVEWLYHGLSDNDTFHRRRMQLERDLTRSEIIIGQSDGIIFDLDPTTGSLVCSPKWKEIFGYDPLSEAFSRRIHTESHIHPDDIPVLAEGLQALLTGQAVPPPVEVRIANAGGRYLWCRIIAAVQPADENNSGRIVGTITNVDALKRATIALKEKAERDALTKLLNKASSQQFISEYLSERPSSELAALLVLDLDNFKSVNDTYGHLYGDSMLSHIGNELKRLFRGEDILGRIGGDEFVILMKNIPHEKLLHDRCELLVNTFHASLRAMAPEVDVSCSIGAALCPAHGTDYKDLFRRADKALYVSKSRGKNTYSLFDSTLRPERGEKRRTTAIDSNERPGLANNAFVHYVFHALYESTDLDATINELLAYIGEQLNVSRVYIFENSEDGTTCSNTFEWCNTGIEPQIEYLQNVHYENDISGWKELFFETNIFYCTDITSLAPHLRAILEPQGIKSMLQCAITDGGKFSGYVGFDECASNRLWNREQIELLKFLAEVFSTFILKKRSQDKITRQNANLQTILDCQSDWIYVIDPGSCEILFANTRARTASPDGTPGERCFEAFQGRCSPCENCPARCIGVSSGASAVLYNPKLGINVHSTANAINWNGKDAALVVCRETK